MGAASALEDKIDRLIGDLRSFAADVGSSEPTVDWKTRRQAYEDTCSRLIARLQEAKRIAADPKLSGAYRIDTLQIENMKLKQQLEHSEKGVDRLRSKIGEPQIDCEKLLRIQTQRAEELDRQNRGLREQVKQLKAVIKSQKRSTKLPKPRRTR